MINHKQIHYLMTVSEEKNISRAAKKLYVSQPALSRMISDIEKEVGCSLFIRTPHGLELTEAGHIYLNGCRRVLNTVRNVSEEIADLQEGVRGNLTLGCSTQTGGYILPHLLNTFKVRYPEVDISIIEAKVMDLEEMVLRGQVDLALTYYHSEPELAYRHLTEDEIFLMAPPSYYQQLEHWNTGTNNPPLSVRSIQDNPFILLKHGRGVRRASDQLLSALEIQPRVLLETDSMHLAASLVFADQAFTFVPQIAIHYLDQFRPGVYFPIQEMKIGRSIYACWRKDEYMTRSMQCALDALTELFSPQTE